MDRSHTEVSSIAAYMMCGSGLESFMSILKHDLVVSYDISLFSSLGTSIGKLTEYEGSLSPYHLQNLFLVLLVIATLTRERWHPSAVLFWH